MFLSCFYHVYQRVFFQLCITNLYNFFFYVFNILMFCNLSSFVRHGLQCFNKVFTMLSCFRGFETCLFNYVFIFQGYVLNDFSNQFNRVANVTKLQYFTQSSWMLEGNLKLAFKLSKNTRGLWEEHYNRIINFCSAKTYLK